MPSDAAAQPPSAPAGRVGAPGTLARLRAGTAARDPGGHLTRRALRAAVLAPATLALARATGRGVPVEFFAGFGALSLCLFVDFGGPLRARARAFGVLVALGCGLLVAGTACSREPALAVAAMAVVGFGVVFAGILGPNAAMASTAALLTFVLPVSTPAPLSAVGDRVGGYLLAAALVVPASLFVWPRRWHDPLRAASADVARRTAAVLGAAAQGPVPAALVGPARDAAAALDGRFGATPYPPTGAGPNDVAMSRLVTRLGWLADRALDGVAAAGAAGPPPGAAELLDRTAATLETAADVVAATARTRRVAPEVLGRLADRVRALERARHAALEQAVRAALAGTDRPTPGDDAERLHAHDPTLVWREIAFGTELVAGLAAQAAGVDPRRAGWDPAAADAPVEAVGARTTLRVLGARVSIRSVWLRNALRAGVGMAAAVAVVEVTDVRRGFWVVLGTLSVLRSNAAGTGASAVRAVAGTVVGVAVASAALLAVGGHAVALWVVFPLAVFVAALAPAMASFTAGQAGFTLAVLVMFNLISPVGWQVGLVRVQDVALGCAVSLVVGLLLWPRGATAALGQALCDAFGANVAYLRAAVRRVADPATGPGEVRARFAAAAAAYHQLDDAFRLYLVERAEKRVPLVGVSELVAGANQVRIGAHLLALSVDAVPRAPGAPRHPLDPAALAAEHRTLGRAADATLAACDALAGCYGGLAAQLAGAPAAPAPPEPVAAGLDGLIEAGFSAAEAAGDPEGVLQAIRLVWASEDLHEHDALRRRLAPAAHLFTTRALGRPGAGAPDER